MYLMQVDGAVGWERWSPMAGKEPKTDVRAIVSDGNERTQGGEVKGGNECVASELRVNRIEIMYGGCIGGFLSLHSHPHRILWVE